MRILTFGYDSALINSTGATPSIQNYARTLFDSLNSQRKGEKVCVSGNVCAHFNRLTDDPRSDAVL